MCAKKILLVDDDVFVLDAFSIYLKSKGYDVKVTTRGKEAFTIVRNEPYKVVILDINMPDLNGIDLCKMIRKENLDVYIISCSGASAYYDKDELEKVGFDVNLDKPMSFSVLQQAVDEAFKRVTSS